MTESDKSPLPPFIKGGAENAPFHKGGRAQRGGILVRDCANLMWSDLVQPVDLCAQGLANPPQFFSQR